MQGKLDRTRGGAPDWFRPGASLTYAIIGEDNGALTGMLLPDHETAVDFLNYEAISKTVIGLLRENRKHALTVGIHGDWGAGKSSVLKMIEMEIGKDSALTCLWFNGWTFQGFDDAKTVLIENTVSELRRQRSAFGKVEELAVRSARSLHAALSTRERVNLW